MNSVLHYNRMPRFNCPVCGSCRLPTLQLMLQHISRIHASSPSFSVTCGLDGCLRTYTNNGSYQKHIKKMHLHYFNVAVESNSNSLVDTPELEDYFEYSDYFEHHDSDCDSIPNDSLTVELEKKQQRAKWILKIRETNKLTQSCTENLLSDITDICTNIVEDIKSEITQKLASTPIATPSITINEISKVCDSETYRQPSIGLETQHKQLQFYRNHLNFVVRNHIITRMLLYLYGSI